MRRVWAVSLSLWILSKQWFKNYTGKENDAPGTATGEIQPVGCVLSEASADGQAPGEHEGEENQRENTCA